ncbi:MULTISPECIES: ATP-binding protein [Streptomyces]|uniref:Anti-sigma regulatory factor (Ser/Thr protein kinase) n=1 Tax=Streptomyces melanosporofaciens TaxID=67327 RepID=A0A1H4QGI3_STRMJ|nr:Anti-sigma regulatory factor (Ser/Thr protein kinase) [Streptomyces melanosporofaciens]
METHQLSFVLPSTPRAVTDTRHRVLAALCGWGLQPGSDVLDSVELATSELVTNAVKHAGPEPFSVDIRLRGGLVRIDVCDAGYELPRLSLPGSADENGRGLLIVTTLAARHDVELTPTGKRCWAEFEVPLEAIVDTKAASAAPSHP